MGQHIKVEQLCHAGIAVDTADSWGNTALILASMYNNVECVQTLLECKANPSAQNKWAGTAIIESSSRGYLDVVKCLVGWGANVNSQNKVGDTALAVAVYNAHVDIVECLVQSGCDPTLRDGKGKTALDRANECVETSGCTAATQQQMVALLHRKRANVKSNPPSPRNPAAHPEVIRLRAELDKVQESHQHLQGAVERSEQLAEENANLQSASRRHDRENSAAQQRIAELESQLYRDSHLGSDASSISALQAGPAMVKSLAPATHPVGSPVAVPPPVPAVPVPPQPGDPRDGALHRSFGGPLLSDQYRGDRPIGGEGSMESSAANALPVQGSVPMVGQVRAPPPAPVSMPNRPYPMLYPPSMLAPPLRSVGRLNHQVAPAAGRRHGGWAQAPTPGGAAAHQAYQAHQTNQAPPVHASHPAYQAMRMPVPGLAAGAAAGASRPGPPGSPRPAVAATSQHTEQWFEQHANSQERALEYYRR